MTAVGKCLRCA